jgi:Flp pilus assembly protein TadD
MSEPHRQTHDLSTAVQHAAQLLARDPALAAEQATEILKVHPESNTARLILASALRMQGEVAKALTIVQLLRDANPDAPNVLHELALCLGAAGKGSEAIGTLNKVLRLDPNHAAAWRSLGDQLVAAGDEKGSEQAYEKHLAASTRHPELIEAAGFLRNGKLAHAERITREVLKIDPVDPVAIRMLADIGIKLGKIDDAISLLERCLELSP